MPMLSFRKRTAARPESQSLTPDQRRFALGARSLADLIAPAAVELARDHLRLDRQYARVLAVTGYPRTVTPGWLAPLLDLGIPLDLSFHFVPLETGDVMSTLSQKLVQFHSSQLFDARSGRIADPERETALDDTERLRDALQRGVERVFSVSLYLLVRAASLPALDEQTRRVEATLAAILAHSRVAVLEQDSGFRSCLPQGQDELLVYRNLDTSSLATLFPFTANTLVMERGVLYGIAARSQAPVIVDPFDDHLENANTAVFATSGAGKSYFTKLLALRSLLAGVDCLILDPEDEYRPLCAAVGGQEVRLASTSPQRLNPFDLPIAARGVNRERREEDPLAEQVAALLGLLEVMLGDPGRPLNAFERALLDQALYRTYAAAGISADSSTHSRPAPLLRDLLAVLETVPGDVAFGLTTRLRRYVDGSLAGLFSGPTNVALDRRCVVFNLQGLEPELRPLGIHLITSFVWRQVRRSRRPRLLIIDEAWSLLQYPEGGAFLAGMARRARKYYLVRPQTRS